jgi:hypothetical protein
VISWLVANPDAESATITTELPFEPIWFAVLAMGFFLTLLLVTFQFRHAATRH